MRLLANLMLKSSEAWMRAMKPRKEKKKRNANRK